MPPDRLIAERYDVLSEIDRGGMRVVSSQLVGFVSLTLL